MNDISRNQPGRHDPEAIRELAYRLWQQAGEPHGLPEEFWRSAERQLGAGEKEYDRVLEDSFPASDAPAHSGTTTAEIDRPDAKPDAVPAGTISPAAKKPANRAKTKA